ncbi:RNA-directed DNA polymerase [Tanacetum coccineum]
MELEKCRICRLAKTHHTNQGLYTPLPTPNGPWEDVSIDFVVVYLCPQRKKKDSIMVVVDRFSKMARLSSLFNTFCASQVAVYILLRSVRLLGVPRLFTLDRMSSSLTISGAPYEALRAYLQFSSSITRKGWTNGWSLTWSLGIFASFISWLDNKITVGSRPSSS